MKNLFFVSVAFSIFSGTSLTATAQKSLNFIDGIDLAFEAGAGAPVFATSAPVHFTSNTGVLATADERMPTENELCTPLQFKYALILDREVETLTNLALYNFIDKWYGTRYRYGGTTKKGIDCSSLTSQLMKAVYSIDLPRTARDQYAACTKISRQEMTEGDLVFFNTRGGVSHVGLLLGDGYFVHASSRSGVTISHMDDTYYKHRFINAGRINPLSIDFTLIKPVSF